MTPDAGVPRTKDLEQIQASRQPQHVAEAAAQIATWWGPEVDPGTLARLAEGVLPSAFLHAVEKLTGRERATVRSPLGLLPSLIADEVARIDDF